MCKLAHFALLDAPSIHGQLRLRLYKLAPSLASLSVFHISLLSPAFLPRQRITSTIMSSSTKPVLTFREPFTIDVLLRWLDRVPFSSPFLLILPALAFLYDRHTNPAAAAVPLGSDQLVPHLKHLLFTQYKWVGYAVSFILIKTLNRALNRYTRNHGAWRRDPINYAKDVVVITGGAAGIGKEVVQILSHEKKATVAVLDVAPPSYAPAPPGAPDILYFKADVTNPEQISKIGAEIRAKTGKKVGVLINCAGVAAGNTILDVDLDSAKRVWQINTLANWVTCQEFVPDMVKANHGHVVTVSSSGAFACLPSMSEYAVSKAGALAFHEVLTSEFKARYNSPRVRTTLVAPTKVRTALSDGMEDHKDPFFTPVLEPIQVARRIVQALDSGLSQYLTVPFFASGLPLLRSMPDWYRTLLAIAGDTDNQVTTKSITRAMKNGYGSNWEGTDKIIYERQRAKLEAQKSK